MTERKRVTKFGFFSGLLKGKFYDWLEVIWVTILRMRLVTGKNDIIKV